MWDRAHPERVLFKISLTFIIQIATDEFACQIRKNISKSFIREIATDWEYISIFKE